MRKIRKLLQTANIGSINSIQNLFEESMAEFMETGLEAELGYSKYNCKRKDTFNSFGNKNSSR